MAHKGIIICPITKKGIDLYLQPVDGITKDIKQIFIPDNEYLRLLDLADSIIDDLGILLDEYESWDIEGENLTELII